MTARRGAVALALAAVVGLTAAATHSAPRAGPLAAPAAPTPLLGVATRLYGASLVRLDPATLRPLARPRLEVGSYQWGWSFSPSRRRLLLSDAQGRVIVVDTRTLRQLRAVDPGGPGMIVVSVWRSERIVDVVSRSDAGTVYVRRLDAARGKVLATHPVAGNVTARGRAGSTLVLLLVRKEGIGPATLCVVEAGGRVRTVALERLRVGWVPPRASGRLEPAAHSDPGLAVDPAGRAFVVAGGAPIAEVDLRTLAVAYHQPASHVSLLGRIHDWLEPPARAKGPLRGPTRTALWIGGGTFAVSGVDDAGWVDRSGSSNYAQTPIGVTLVDSRTWSARRVSATASRVTLGGGVLLVHASLSYGRLAEGIGLVGLTADGTERFHVLGDTPIWEVQVVGDRAIVQRKGGFAIVDLEAGRVVREAPGGAPRVLTLEGGPCC